MAMNLRRAFGISLVAAAVSLTIPALLSAQGDDADPEQTVTLTILGDGSIRVSGNVVLETPDRATHITAITASSMAIDRAGMRVVDFSQGLTVELGNYVVEAESGAIMVGEGQVQQLLVRDAVISPEQ
jgi:hypothetical protein